MHIDLDMFTSRRLTVAAAQLGVPPEVLARAAVHAVLTASPDPAASTADVT